VIIIKERWEIFHYKILDEISDISHDADVAAFVMEEGVAHLCYVKPSITIIK
jgi:stalled ribosome rescue protein Dom34